MHDRPAHFIRNEDGDTVTMFLDQGFGDNKTVNIRLANVWAPEPEQVGYADVTKFVYNWFLERISRTSNRYPFVVYFVPTRTGTYRMSYNRYVATIMTADGKQSLNADVMSYILLKGYEGGTGWTDILRKDAPQ